MKPYHATTQKKAKQYRQSGSIHAPVRQAPQAPGHHNEFGEAWWNDGDVTQWRCVFFLRMAMPSADTARREAGPRNAETRRGAGCAAQRRRSGTAKSPKQPTEMMEKNMNKLTKTALLLAVAWSGLLALTGCAPDPNMEMQTGQHRTAQYAPTQESQRVTVQRIGVFRDDVAYNSTRAIYIITDSATGREFIGVSGVGIAETGSHYSGKMTISDER